MKMTIAALTAFGALFSAPLTHADDDGTAAPPDEIGFAKELQASGADTMGVDARWWVVTGYRICDSLHRGAPPEVALATIGTGPLKPWAPVYLHAAMHNLCPDTLRAHAHAH